MNDDPLSQQERIETAAEGSAHYFQGRKLEPFSFMRQTAWQRLGWQSDFESKVAIVFICSLGDEIADPVLKLTGKDIIRQTRSVEGIASFHDRLSAWADGLKMTGNNATGIECSKVGFAIWKESEDGEFHPIVKDGPAGPNG